MPERALIYVTGSDSSLRDAGHTLIELGLSNDVDLLDQASLFVNEKGKRKVGASGRGMVVVVDKDRVSEALGIIKRLHGPDKLAGYALPIIDTI